MTKISHPNYESIYVFDGEDTISNELKKNMIWEDALCNKLAENYVEGTDFLDIGANIGMNSIRMNQIKKITGTVHLFEPQPDVFLMLKYNTRNLNRKLYNLALSDKNSYSSFTQKTNNVGATQIGSNLEISIATSRLDDFQFPNTISLMKIDVEGHEESMLNGGKETIMKHKPIIVIEIWPHKKEVVSQLLNSFGYFQTEHLGGDDYLYKFR
jgi:FkbM family methyltransferase